MHVAILCEYPTLHGGERSLLAVVDELRLRQTDMKATVLAPASGPLAAALAERRISHVGWSVKNDAGERREANELETSLLETISSLQPDLVHANSLSMGRLLGRIAPRLGVPTTTHLRDIIKLGAGPIADLNRHARLIAVSDATRTHHVGQGLDAAKTIVIRNGVDLEAFHPRPVTGWLKQELALPSSARLVATIGQISLRKGWDVLAEAAKLVAERQPEAHFLLIGARHSDKPESREYEAQLRHSFSVGPLTGRAHWLGERDDIPRVLNEIDLLVHPALEEPLGRVLLEGLASGVPIVATDVGGTPEIIESDISGELVPPRDPSALSAAIGDVLSHPELTQRYRLAARRRAEEHFPIQDSAQAIWACWKGVVTKD